MKYQAMNTFSRNRHQGYSLVELMVAMALGLFLVLGVGNIFIANKTTYKVQEGMSQTQESGRYAIQRIAKSVHGAGYFGCMPPNIVKPKVIAALSGSPEVDLADITDETAIFGIDNVTSGNSLSAVTGTDVLTLRGTGDGGIAYTGAEVAKTDDIPVTAGSAVFYEADLVIISDCSASNLFRTTDNGTPLKVALTCVTDSVTCNSKDELSTPYGEDALLLKPYIHSFFIRDTGRDNAAGQDIHGLYMRDIKGNVWEFVEGVSDLQVLYGVDVQNNDNAANRYMNASQVTAASEWSNVVSIKISLLVDSVEDTLQEAKDYVFMGTSHTPTDKKLRQEFSGLFSLRNSTL